MALHLLDANVLIDAHRDYYPMDRVPEFWRWLENLGTRSMAKIPAEILDELKVGKDDLASWAKRRSTADQLLLKEEVNQPLVVRAVSKGYAPDLTDDEIEKLGNDPFLIAYALRDPGSRRIVTTERSKPSRVRANRHLPDACTQLGLTHLDTFAFVRALDFRTDWDRHSP